MGNQNYTDLIIINYKVFTLFSKVLYKTVVILYLIFVTILQWETSGLGVCFGRFHMCFAGQE